MEISVTPAQSSDAAELAAVAAETFPLACPKTVPADDIGAFIADHLSEKHFDVYLADPDRVILTATIAGRIIGYAMLICYPDTVELSKMYVLADRHGSGAASALMNSGIVWAAEAGAVSMWLGVNRENARAQQFYRKHGFEVSGTRTFRLGASTEHDFVMTRLVQPGSAG